MGISGTLLSVRKGEPHNKGEPFFERRNPKVVTNYGNTPMPYPKTSYYQ